MSSFEKYQASAEARRDTHGDHIDKLTGYFLAETNRMREQAEPPKQETPKPASEPPPEQRKRFRWWGWWRTDS